MLLQHAHSNAIGGVSETNFLKASLHGQEPSQQAVVA